MFPGFWRLGKQTGRDFLGVDPDIAVYSKLLSGGALPLGVTATSKEIFDAFYGDEVSEALLHGES